MRLRRCCVRWAAVQSPELFLAGVLFIAVGTGAAAAAAGLSMSLGAFIAGLVLAETEYRRAIEAIIEPFKGLLLGFFFLLVGLNLDLGLLLQQPIIIISSAVAMMVLKVAVILVLGRLFRLPNRSVTGGGAAVGARWRICLRAPGPGRRG